MLYVKVRDIKTPFTRNLYHRSTLQIIRQSSGGLVLPKSGIKPFLTGGLNEITIFRPRLLDLLYSYIFPDSKTIQTYKGIIVIITYFLFIGK